MLLWRVWTTVAGLLLRDSPPEPFDTLGSGRWGAHAHVPYRQKLSNYMNVQYFTELHIGGQVVTGIMDTGSFELVVMSDRCKVCVAPPYNSSESATFHPSSQTDPVMHYYGSGPTLSFKGYEHVSVGPLVSWNQTFYELADHNISALDEASFDAIVGIGMLSDSEDASQSLLSGFNVSEYSVCLERPSLAPGWLVWGGDLGDRSMALEAPVIGKHHWAVALTHVLPTGLSLNALQRDAAGTLLCAGGCAAVLDSGTSLIAAPSTALQGLALLLPEVHTNCSNFADLPDLEMDVGGHRLLLPPETYVLRMSGTQVEADTVYDILHFKPKILKVNECFPAFMPIDRRTKFGPLWILGMPFFRQFHVTFSAAERERRVFLAHAGADCKPEKLEAEPTDAKLDTDYPFPEMEVLPQARRIRRERARAPLTVDARELAASARLAQARFGSDL